MRFLANENFPGAAVGELRIRGHDVVWVREAAPGSSDRQVLDSAIREKRILVTFDLDFGELARTSNIPLFCGIVLLRIRMPKPVECGTRIADLISSRDDWAGNFSVVEHARIRMRPLSPR